MMMMMVVGVVVVVVVSQCIFLNVSACSGLLVFAFSPKMLHLFVFGFC